MSPEAVALGRDLALILLIVEAVVLVVPLLVIPFYVIKYLRRFKEPVRPTLRRVRLRVEKVEHVTKLASSMAVQPFLWGLASAEGLRRGLSRVSRRM